jgi:hypothetical protein
LSAATGILHVVNAPSPAATASLAIGERIVATVDEPPELIAEDLAHHFFMIPHEVITSTANPRLKEAARSGRRPAPRPWPRRWSMRRTRSAAGGWPPGIPLVELLPGESILVREGSTPRTIPMPPACPSGADLDGRLCRGGGRGTRVAPLGRTAFGKLAFRQP